MTIQQLDFAVLDWIQAHLKCGALDFLMTKITLLGEYGIFFILIGIALLLRKSHRICGAAVLTGLTSGLIIGNLLLKNLIARPRPCWINTDIRLLIANPTDYSLPSGHALHCFIAASVLMYYDKRLGWPMLGIAILVSFSRMYLYVHFPTDILAGAALGVAIGLLSAFAFDKLRARRNARSMWEEA